MKKQKFKNQNNKSLTTSPDHDATSVTSSKIIQKKEITIEVIKFLILVILLVVSIAYLLYINNAASFPEF